MIKSLFHWVDYVEPTRIWEGRTLLKYRIFLDHDSKQHLLEFKSPTNDYWTYEPFENHIREIYHWLNDL